MSETIRLSYAELAEKLGISREAAKSRVRRAGWQRVADNTGIVKFNVPKDVFDTPCRLGVDTATTEVITVSPTPHIDTDATLAAIEALKGALNHSEAARAEAERRLVALSEQLGRVTAERDAALERIVETALPTSEATPLKETPKTLRKWWSFLKD